MTDATDTVPPSQLVLLIEDNPGDARLCRELLQEAGAGRFTVRHAASLAAGLAAVVDSPPAVVLLDLNLPDGSGLSVLEKLAAVRKDLPIIVLTGLNDEQVGMQAVRAGAQDYLVKGDASGNAMVRAIHYAIHRKQEQQEREQLISQLQDALAQVRQLHGLLPICASCKKIREDSGYWRQIEEYIRDHSEAQFTHGICPECSQIYFPGITLGGQND